MNTLICQEPFRFGFEERPDPMLLPGHAILRIRRIGICGTDLHAFEGTQPYFQYPRILGHELAAEIAAIEAGQGFEEGETVSFLPYLNCGHCIACRRGKTNCCSHMQVMGVHVDGGMADYIQVPVDKLVKSRGLSLDELALVEPLAIGAHAVRIAQVQPGDLVLVVGAGPIGMAAMEFAQLADAEVIALDRNAGRLEHCRQSGRASWFINGAGQPILERLQEISRGDMPVVVMDATGNLNAIEAGLSYLAHGGKYVLIGLQKEAFSFSHPEFHKKETTLMSSRNATREDFEQVTGAIAGRQVDALSLITHRVPFTELHQVFPSWLDPANGVLKAMVNKD